MGRMVSKLIGTRALIQRVKTEEEEKFCNGINPSGDSASQSSKAIWRTLGMGVSGMKIWWMRVDGMKRVIEMKRVWFGR